MPSNFHIYNEDRERGMSVQKRFSLLAENGCGAVPCKIGLDFLWIKVIRPSSKQEEKIKKVDFLVNIIVLDNSFKETNKRCKCFVEIKGSKKINKTDNEFSEDFVLEHDGVGESLGWLNGKASFIIFERENEFLMFPRVSLLNFYRANVIRPPMAKPKNKNLIEKKIEYWRKGNWEYNERNLSERFAYFDKEDILSINHWTIDDGK